MNDLYEKVTLAGIFKNIQPVPKFIRDTFFSDEEVFLTSKIQFDIVKDGTKVAPFVNPRVGGKVLENTGYSTKEYEPPLLAPQKVLTAADLKYRQPGEHIYISSSIGQRAVKKVVEDLESLNKSIDLREELMCSELLSTGKVSVKGEGIDEVITLGSIETDVLTGTDRWDQAGADIVGDLTDLKSKVSESGYTPDVIVTSSKVARLIFANEEVRKWFNTINYNNGVIQPEVLKSGGIYWGYVPVLGCHIYSYEAKYADYDNVNPAFPNVKTTDAEFKPEFKRYIPENRLFMTHVKVGKRAYGLILDIQLGDATMGKKRVTKSWDENSPSAKFLEVQSKPLPLIHNLDAVGILEVL